MFRRILPAILVAPGILILTALPWVGFDSLFTSMVLADDDDDDGGDDDDDDDGSRRDDDDDGGRRDDDDDGGRPVLAPSPTGTPTGTPTRAPAPVAPAPPPPVSAPDEIVTLDLTEADLDLLVGQGFALIEERSFANFDAVSRRLRIPPDMTLIEARAAARTLESGQSADFNHYYRSEQGFAEDCNGIECPARVLLDWPINVSRDGTCGRGVPLGMIDTGINGDHETFTGADLEIVRLDREDAVPSRALHGTAIAALLVGDPATRSPGLVPGARLVAVDAFSRVGSDERADVFSLLEAFDLLAEEEVSVINLSLAGPANTVLEQSVARLVGDLDIVLVAAVGNAGPAAEPGYPAAYPPVIAVTAVDRASVVYRRAVRGAHVDLAAPGVDVWSAASISGARPQTGTSFAVPFVSAAAALLRAADPDLTAGEVENALRSAARDIGDPGPDEVYGAGLIQIDPLCRENL